MHALQGELSTPCSAWSACSGSRHLRPAAAAGLGFRCSGHRTPLPPSPLPPLPPMTTPVCPNLAATFRSPPFSAAGGQMLAAALDSSPSVLQTTPSQYCVLLLGESTDLVMGLTCRATSADRQTVRDIFITNCVAHPRFPPTPPLAFLSPSPPPSPPAQPPPSDPTSLRGNNSMSAPVIAGIAVGSALGIVALITIMALITKHRSAKAAIVHKYADSKASATRPSNSSRPAEVELSSATVAS